MDAPLPNTPAQTPTTTPTRAQGRLGGGLFSMIGKALPNVLRALQPKSTLEVLQERLLAVQLAKALDGAAVPFQALSWPLQLTRSDHLLLGPRGSGKTASSVTLAHGLALAQEHTQRPLAVDWPKKHAEALGLESSPGDAWRKVKDRVVILDESSLRVPTGKRIDAMFEALALARHNGLSTIWTSQSASSANKDLLRLDPILWFCGASQLGSKFDREELLDLFARATTLGLSQGWQAGDRALRVIFAEGQWATVRLPLPIGWTDTTSKLWRS